MGFKKIQLLLICLILIVSCAPPKVHITANDSSFSFNNNKPIEVFVIKYSKLLDFIERSIEENSPSISMRRTITGIYASENGITVFIEPILVIDKDSNRTGYTIKMKVPSGTLLHEHKDIYKYLKKQNIKTLTFKNYKINERIKSVVDKIPTTVPTDTNKFKKYILEHRKNKYEGIWEHINGELTLGIIKNETKGFKFSGFILNTSNMDWKIGEIFVSFTDLKEGYAPLAVAHTENKIRVRAGTNLKGTVIQLVNNRYRVNEHFTQTFPTASDIDDINSMGTGWYIKDGYIITNYHVVKDADRLIVEDLASKKHTAKVILKDQYNDLAIIYCNTLKRPPLPLSPNAIEATGITTYALGFPLGKTQGTKLKITKGIITSQTGLNDNANAYQSSSHIKHGNSGGPLIDEYGNVIGINTRGINLDGPTGFAVKIQYLKFLLQQAGVKFNVGQKTKKYTTEELYKMYEKSVVPIWVDGK